MKIIDTLRKSSRKMAIFLIPGIFFSILSAIIGVYIPLVVRNMIDLEKNIGSIEILKVVSLFLSQALVSSVGIYLVSRYGEEHIFELRNTVFSKIISCPVSFFEKHRSGELSSKLVNNTNYIRIFFTNALPSFVSSGVDRLH
ncbi:ABC transporter transmembrane domain-containing protein [Enterococcus sp. AD013-P3]|uniref:ABC transporter transmembrane domain-containing protein n=1 Tax=Enterococcus sp. AD013-P3 TaxID=3411036 RepID=UPI003B93D989